MVVTLAPDLPLVQADQILLNQVLANVVGNAVRYAGPAAKIEVAAQRGEGSIDISVTDNGPAFGGAAGPCVREIRARASDRAERRRGRRPWPRHCQGHYRGPWRHHSRRKPGAGAQRWRAHVLLAAARRGRDGMNDQRILVVDDEPAIHRFLQPALSAAGYVVVKAEDGASALREVATHPPDAVVLDLGLPDMDGKEVIQRLRQFSKVPVIVLSARDREVEKIEALDLGADDFVNKPFGVGELMARIRAALRQRAPETISTPCCGWAAGDRPAPPSGDRDGVEVKLTPKEFDLLVYLARHSGKVLTHRQILGAVWGTAHLSDTQYLRVYVGQLRQRLEAEPAAPTLILTEAGIGYRMAE